MTSPMNPRSGTERPPILSGYLLPALRLALTTGAYWYAAPVLLGAAAGRLDGVLPPCRFPAAVRLGGLVLALAGGYLFLRAWLTLATMGKEWPRGRPVLLVADHIYAFARHPLYLGYAAAFLGWSIWRSSPGLCLVSMALGLTLAGYARFVEEPMLLARFGSKFADYRRRVPFFPPRWRALREGALELNLFLLFTLLVFRWLFRFLWRVEVEGQEHVPERGGFLLVANHVNLADPFLIGLFLTRRVHFMASDELFRRPLFRLLFGKFWPAFPKRRWGRDIGALRHAERLLARGEAVGIFPEGARNWDGGPVSVGDEVYRFIHHCRAPVLAASIRGGHESLPRWASWPSFTRVTIRFFPPLAPEDASSYAELRRRIEPRIFSGAYAPPVERRVWKSHRGLPTVIWGCLRCGTARAIAATGTGLRCRACGATWRVTPSLQLVDETGTALLERDYHARLRDALAAGEIKGGLTAWCRAEGYRVRDGRLIPLGRGELVLDRSWLSFDDGRRIHRLSVPEIKYAFLNLRNRLVVSDHVQTLELKIIGDSPVRFEDYLGAARLKPMRLWRPSTESAAELG